MRKRPQQQRSRQMVDTLIDATARCIAQRGLEGTSTPVIAELAGVSVGSLYQYFESKEALIDALVERIAQQVTQVLRAGVPAAENLSLPQLTRNAIRAALALLHSNEGLYLELVRNWYRLPTHRVVDTLQQFFLEITRLYFSKHHRQWQVENLHTKVFIIVNSTIFTVVRYLSEEPPFISERELVDELTLMISAYLGVNESGASSGFDSRG